MKNFISSLNRVSNTFSNESNTIRYNEGNLDTRFVGLRSTVKKSLIMKPKPRAESSFLPNSPNNPHPPRIINRSHISHSLPISAPSQKKTNLLPSYPQQPVKKRYPAKPTIAAHRIYQSHATQKFYEDILYGYVDYLENPTPSGFIQYESQIDPVLHVGPFQDNELNRFGEMPPLYFPQTK